MFEMQKKIIMAYIAMLVSLITIPTAQNFKTVQTQMVTYVDQLKKDGCGMSNIVIAGIMICIVGFVMLFIGLYIVFTVQTSLPSITSTTYNNTVTSLNSYVATTFPILGLALMVIGFAIILASLMGGLGGGRR